MEIYNEVIRDLLKPGNDNLKIHEIVMSPQDIASLMQKGDGNRHVGGTNMNERSSRSHTIFRMVTNLLLSSVE
jgi:centromeric protein E